ncbi:helix-hairpin-helix domain-containing protein [Halegenticoccus soli]|uniref:helix-hairpin-helix domain-containing protein n=1 Tax=Halegenticoccus soli TaxID=1985678 RepID=UPI000C6E84E9|nr:helix-hairpin-helix domain-containing protein [Halegenticoccus soli]
MRVSVRVDDREPPSLVEEVRAHPDVEDVTVVRLPAGDVAVDGVGFERKTLRDYVSSAFARSGTDLREQIERLNARYGYSYVLVEADLSDTETIRSGVSPASIRGSMASITARTGTPVIPCSDRRLLVDFAVRLGRKHLEDPSERRLNGGAVTDPREPTPKRMYGCIDGVGPEIATTLYEAYPTVESLLAAAPEELMRIEGIGPKRARTIHAAFRTAE